jgi:LDH2 family malate/lactate/ureidoglycolate dehydrogenase
MRKVSIAELHRCLASACTKLGLGAEYADRLAGLLVDSELRGHRDHGIAAFGPLAAMYGDGRLNPRPDVRVVSETDGTLLLDGDRGCGPRRRERVERGTVPLDDAGWTLLDSGLDALGVDAP